MTTVIKPSTTRLKYNRTIGVAAMQGRGFYYPWSGAVAENGKIFVMSRGTEFPSVGVRITVMDIEEEYFGTFGSYGKGTASLLQR